MGGKDKDRRPNGVREEKLADGAIKRTFRPDGSRRTEIKSPHLRANIVINGNTSEMCKRTGLWGMLIVEHKGRETRRTYLQISRWGGEVPVFAFDIDGERLGSAVGSNFDLAIAKEVGRFSVPQVDQASGDSRVEQRVVNVLKTMAVEYGSTSPDNLPPTLLRRRA